MTIDAILESMTFQLAVPIVEASFIEATVSLRSVKVPTHDVAKSRQLQIILELDDASNGMALFLDLTWWGFPSEVACHKR